MMTTANPLDNTGKPIKTMDYLRTTGLVYPNCVVDQGLIYDATPQDYVNLLCSMNFPEQPFKTIARTCANPSNDINYPSFTALYIPNGDYAWLEQKFRRKSQMLDLVQLKKNQKQDYTLTIHYIGDIEFDQAQFGSITWWKRTVITP
ncbi:hypothetical protein R3W88_033420 [Solanum pinnatisectum]|uniref:Uncharacterized protein n=1 Tax=Solanum pinnatisectum TaxID=50273 RepID=A0AAV9K172_9SOLN|nr:hypothetical protein R3W88_033420 [Solanum pinnatisectum]